MTRIAHAGIFALAAAVCGAAPVAASVLHGFGEAENQYITEILFDTSVYADIQAAAED